MIYTALVPVKSLNEVKSRLAAHLDQAQRAALVLDMLHHVINILRSVNELEKVVVVSPDIRVLELVQQWGGQALQEEQKGHNPALTAAAEQELAQGTDALLTISADLPLLQIYDIYSMIKQAQAYDVILAPSQDGTGTNAILMRPPLALPYVFGPNSRQRFLTEAARRNLSASTYTSASLQLDVDTIDDLRIYQQKSERFSCLYCL